MPNFFLSSKRHICEKDWKYCKNELTRNEHLAVTCKRHSQPPHPWIINRSRYIHIYRLYILLQNHSRITKRHVENKVLERSRLLLATAGSAPLLG